MKIKEVVDLLIPSKSTVDLDWETKRQSIVSTREAELEPYSGPIETPEAIVQTDRLEAKRQAELRDRAESIEELRQLKKK